MKPLISIIVPIYNVAKYLGQCIESLVNQTYANLEIILVDDGSTDQSGEMCDIWKNTDSRIKVIHKHNGGQAEARNAGIEIASGEWLMFVDADDYVEDSFCEHALQLVQESLSDIGVFNYLFCWDDHAERSKESVVGVYENKEAMYQLLSGCTQHYVWNKIYRRELFTGIRYPDGRLWEDLGTVYKLFARAKTINFSQEVLYYYRQRSGSTVHTISVNALYDIYQQYTEMHLFCQIHYPKYADMVWDQVVIYALICCIKDYAHARERGNYQELRKCLKGEHRIPQKMAGSKKIMMFIFRISEGLFYRICAVVYFMKGKNNG